MTTATYTRDGETEYEPVYDLPEAEDANVHLLPADADDGAESVTVTLGEFNAEFTEYEEGDDVATKYLRERARNGHGIQ